MKKILQLCIVLFALISTSCTQRLVDFTVISTRNVPIGKNTNLVTGTEKLRGTDRAIRILGIPLRRSNMEEAIDEALDKHPGSVGLANGVVYFKRWNAIIVGSRSYVVTGHPVFVKEEDNTSETK